MSTATANNYIATFILDTRGYQESVETLIEVITTAIDAVGGSVKKLNNMGPKNFTRVTDRKFPAGIYVDITIEGPSSLPKDLHDKLRLNRNIDRILIQSL